MESRFTHANKPVQSNRRTNNNIIKNGLSAQRPKRITLLQHHHRSKIFSSDQNTRQKYNHLGRHPPRSKWTGVCCHLGCHHRTVPYHLLVLQLFYSAHCMSGLQLLSEANSRWKLFGMPQRIQIGQCQRIDLLLEMSHTISVVCSWLINLLLFSLECLYFQQLPSAKCQLILLINLLTEYPNLRW